MQLKFYLSLNRQLVKGLLLSSLIVITLCFSATAQKHNNQGLTYGGGSNGGSYSGYGSDWGMAINAGYDAPTGNLGQTYKGAPTFGISVLHNIGDFTFNATIGYVSYAPKSDTSYANGIDNSDGYFKNSHFTSVEIYAGAAYNIQMGDAAKFYVGVNVGSYYIFFTQSYIDGGQVQASTTDLGQSYIAPKLGVKFPVSDNLDLGLEAKYNFSLSSNSGSGDAYDYGYGTTVFKSYSGNLTLTYNF